MAVIFSCIVLIPFIAFCVYVPIVILTRKPDRYDKVASGVSLLLGIVASICLFLIIRSPL